MNSLDKITLKSFLAALLQQEKALPETIQKQLNEVSTDFVTNISLLGLFVRRYPPLSQEYKKARRVLQQDGERKRSATVETVVSAAVSDDEQLINFTAKLLREKDPVASLKRAYAKHSAVRSLFEELDYPDIDDKQATDISPEAEATSNKAQIYSYNISELVGKICMATQKGQKVYDLIQPHLLAGNFVELDFSEVEICVTPFLSFAIGQLLKDIPLEKLKRLLSINNLDSVGQETLEIIFEDYSHYYSDPQFRSTVDRVISESLNTP